MKNKYLRKIRFKRYAKYFYMGFLCLGCFILGIYFTYSKFSVSKDTEVIRTTVGDFISGDVVIGAYINGEYSKTLPQKSDGYIAEKVVCDNNAIGEWDYEKWSLITKNITTRSKCNVYFKDGVLANYDYSDSEGVFTVPISGTYKLEVWGAQGGGWFHVTGGYGGYATGQITLSKNDKLYINIGRFGENKGENTNYIIPAGGGATYIALSSGKLSTFKNNLSSLLIVAGGGGGSEWAFGYGGSGGGFIGSAGGKGKENTMESITPTAQGATQTSGGTSTSIDSRSNSTNIYNGTFGQGGYSIGGDGGGQGGNGFYGGGASDYAGGGGGGSGYIGNSLLTQKVMYCYECTESTEENTKTTSTTCKSETPDESCSKEGNGYAKITLITTD